MDSPKKSPRRELQIQGPRPTPLKINKDSRKIKKPPLPPPPQSQSQSQPQPRLPVIIYTVSPKVIHTDPNEFKDLVQRLTGQSSCSSSDDRHRLQVSATDAISPAAHYATVEKANNNNNNNSHEKKKQAQQRLMGSMEVEWIDMNDKEVDHVTPFFPAGILSPGPTFLPQIPSGFFTPPPADPSPLSSFFQDLSPILHQAARNWNGNGNGNRNFIQGGGSSNFIPNPSNLMISPNYNNLINIPDIDPSNPFLDKDYDKYFPEFL